MPACDDSVDYFTENDRDRDNVHYGGEAFFADEMPPSKDDDMSAPVHQQEGDAKLHGKRKMCPRDEGQEQNQ